MSPGDREGDASSRPDQQNLLCRPYATKTDSDFFREDSDIVAQSASSLISATGAACGPGGRTMNGYRNVASSNPSSS